VLASWCLCACVLFSLTDWRQTKHLMNEAAAMTAAAVCLAWPALARRRSPSDATGTASVEASPASDRATLRAGVRPLRVAALLALVVALAVCLRIDARLVRDFSSLRVLGASDVDGW